MCARMYCFLVLFVVSLSLGGASSRHLHVFATNIDHIQNQSESLTPNDHHQAMGNVGKNKKIGSRPPSCEHKCYGCMPCEAIQVPTTTSHFGILYTNYEPEGWKCKCGPAFYTP